MSDLCPKQRPMIQFPPDFELPFFEPDTCGVLSLPVRLDPTQPLHIPAAPREPQGVDSNCACE